MGRKKTHQLGNEVFPVSQLKGISFFFRNDVYECARLLLKLDYAKGKATNEVGRYTVHGLARQFAGLAEIPEQQVLAEFQRRKLPLKACVDFDSNAAPAIASGPQFSPDAAEEDGNLGCS